jgi:hypothetical protein
LIKQLTPIVEQYLVELDQKQIFVPSLAASITPAGQTLRPNSNPIVAKQKSMKDLFRVIQTTPLIVTLLQNGLVDPAILGLGQEQEEQNQNDGENVDDEGEKQEEVD